MLVAQTHDLPVDKIGCTEVRDSAKLAERLAFFHEIDRAILTARSPEAIAQAALVHLRRLTGCQRATVGVFGDGIHEVTVFATHAGGKTKVKSGVQFSTEVLGNIRLLKQGKIHHIHDLSKVHDLSLEMHAYLEAEGVRSCMSIGLVHEGELLGCLNLGSENPNFFNKEHEEIAREVSTSLAIALQHARYREELKKHTLELERRVEERTEQLKELNQELEAFTYTVSHDLGVPLRNIQGLARMLKEDFGNALGPTGMECVELIDESARNQSNLIRDLLAYTRVARSDLPLGIVNLLTLINETLRLLHTEISHSRASISLEVKAAWLKAEPVILQQALQNLIGNAIKYSYEHIAPTIVIGTEQIDRWVTIWVRDRGVGIAPENHERIFKIFERVPLGEHYQGTGIGLATVKKAVEKMGGKVGVESALGSGSKFWISLPAS